MQDDGFRVLHLAQPPPPPSTLPQPGAMASDPVNTRPHSASTPRYGLAAGIRSEQTFASGHMPRNTRKPGSCSTARREGGAAASIWPNNEAPQSACGTARTPRRGGYQEVAAHFTPAADAHVAGSPAFDPRASVATSIYGYDASLPHHSLLGSQPTRPVRGMRHNPALAERPHCKSDLFD
eukprot:4540065-Prymnesium_polylepis.2